MNILHISSTDEEGQRFNGYELHQQLTARHIPSHMLVWNKKSNCDSVKQITTQRFVFVIQNLLCSFEKRLGLQSIFSPFSFLILIKKEFWQSDIVHLQLIHQGFFSLLLLPIITRCKKTIWTLHDPWALSDWCVHPEFCATNPILACRYCRQKNRRHSIMWFIKKLIFRMSRFEIVVASKWMEERVRQSEMMSKKTIHFIPFGVDNQYFHPLAKSLARKKLAIPNNAFVIGFRANPNPYKGLTYICDLLDRLSDNKQVVVIALDKPGLLKQYASIYHIIEPGFVTNSQLLGGYYQAMDVFIMPSLAESFGMMALEAMACGTPVIAFNGTAMDEIIKSSENGFVITAKDNSGLVDSVNKVLHDQEFRVRLGDEAALLAQRSYSVDKYINNHILLYTRLSGA